MGSASSCGCGAKGTRILISQRNEGDDILELPTEAQAAEEETKQQREQDLANWVFSKFRTKLKVRKVVKAMNRFVPQELINEIGDGNPSDVDIGDLNALHRNLLIVDVRNFTMISERMNPNATFSFVNEICSKLLPCIESEGGIVVRFLGDAVMAIFEDPTNALKASLKIHLTINQRNKVSSDEKIIVNVGVGLHTGSLLLGIVGDGKQLSVSSLGKAISIASFAESATKSYSASTIATDAFIYELLMSRNQSNNSNFNSNSIQIDTDFARQIAENCGATLRKLDRVKVNHGSTHESVLLFEIASLGDLNNSFIVSYERALNSWLSSNPKESLRLLKICSTERREDVPTQILAARMREIIDSGKPSVVDERGLPFCGLVQSKPKTLPRTTSISHRFATARIALAALKGLQQKPNPTSQSSAQDPQNQSRSEEQKQPQVNRIIEMPPLLRRMNTSGFTTGAALLFIQQIKTQQGQSGNPATEATNSRQTLNPNDSSSLEPKKIAHSILENSQADVMDILQAAAAHCETVPISIPQNLQEKVEAALPQMTEEQKRLALMVLNGFSSGAANAVELQSRFKPGQLMERIGKGKLEEVDIGDAMLLTATVMFCEMHVIQSSSYMSTPAASDSSARSDSSELEAEEMLEAVSKHVIPNVINHEGFVDKFFDNTILALFESGTYAIIAALRILESVSKSAINRDNGTHRISVTISINTGPLMLGTVGNEQRMEITVIGNTVNVCSRMLHIAHLYDSMLVASANTCVGLPREHPEFSLRQLDLVQLSGTTHSLWIFEVFPTNHPLKSIVDIYHTGMEAYQIQDFKKAGASFNEALTRMPNDTASRLFADRCASLLKNGVPINWTPVSIMQSKY